MSRAPALIGLATLATLTAGFPSIAAGTAAAETRRQDLVLPGVTAQPSASPATPTQSIPVDRDPGDDARAADRLREIYRAIDTLEGVEVQVSAGVVTLSGTVPTEAARERAAALARRVDGVVDVTDRLVAERRLARRVDGVLAALRTRALGIIAATPLVVAGLAIVLVFVLMARIATAVDRPYRVVARNRFARDLLRQAVRAVIVIGGVLIALQVMDATAVVATVAGAAGLAGLALSFAFRDLAENYIASILLSLRHPFLPHDYVSIEGHEGRVIRLTSRATVLMTLDGNHVRVPNATVFKGVLVNYTRNPRRRFDFTAGVGSGTDLAGAIDLGRASLQRLPFVLADPPPRGWVVSLGDFNVVLRFVAWIDQRRSDWDTSRGEGIRAVKEAFDAAGILMPEPIVNLQGPGQPPATGQPPAQPGAEAGATPPTPQPPAPAPSATGSPTGGRHGPAEACPPDSHIDQEVERDRARHPGTDLLDPDAPSE